MKSVSWVLTATFTSAGLFGLACAKDSPNTAGQEVGSQIKKTPQTESADAPSKAGAKPGCERQPFARSVDLAEASGATYLSAGELLVVGDSGTHGAFVVLDASSGELLRKGQLPLDSIASDDLEGVSVMGGKVFAITSSGWMREWTQEEDSFTLLRDSYALAPKDAKALVCESPTSINCAMNYEGLCLQRSPDPGVACVGVAAAKATGELVCLVLESSGKLALNASRRIKVASPKSLSGCDFDEKGRLWFGTNFFAGSQIGFVEGWQSPETSVLTMLGSAGFGFPEAIALGKGGQVLRVSDTSGSPSLLSKYICR